MSILLIASAFAGFASAIGHTYLGERFVLRPLFAARADNRVLSVASMRRLLRWVWHLPSFAWAQVGAATLWLAFAPSAWDQASRDLLIYFGVGIYLTGAFFNLVAVRGPHVGNILLTVAAAALWFGASG